MKRLIISVAAWFVLAGWWGSVHAGTPKQKSDVGDKPILVVTTDIGGDPDDQQSLTRLLVYSNEFDIQALIASASGTRGELGVDTVKEQLIREYVSAYGAVYGMLKENDSGYPAPDSLMARICKGNPHRGMEHIGEGEDTEGSEQIIRVVDSAGDRSVSYTHLRAHET